MAREAVVWRDCFSVGDPLIDEQHQQFFREVERVLAAIDQGAGLEALAAFYHDFYLALVEHFQDEEAVLERANYPGLEEHRAEHRALLDSISEISDARAAGREPLDLRRAVQTAFMALVEHVIGVDMRFKSHLMAMRGV